MGQSHSFTLSLPHLLAHSLTHSDTHSHPYWLIPSTHLLTHSHLTHSHPHLLTHSLAHTLTPSLTHILTCLHTHSLTPSLHNTFIGSHLHSHTHTHPYSDSLAHTLTCSHSHLLTTDSLLYLLTHTLASLYLHPQSLLAFMNQQESLTPPTTNTCWYWLGAAETPAPRYLQIVYLQIPSTYYMSL